MATFNFSLDRTNGDPLAISAISDRPLFLLGANGTGKSSLMQRLSREFRGALRISAHRQNWFSSTQMSIAAQAVEAARQNATNSDVATYSRWRDDYAAYRAEIPLHDLISVENSHAREIAELVTAGRVDDAQKLAAKESPLAAVNSLLRQSNIPVKISLQGHQLLASRQDGISYSVAQLSDGERNAMILAAMILTAVKASLILVDEPERHLHRAIIAPLLKQLFAKRRDCAFVISTHEVMLPLLHENAQTLLLRNCTYQGDDVRTWDADLLPSSTSMDEDLKRDILGARRTILFVEGEESSLDKPLYALLFPDVSVIPKASCRDVEHVVSGIRGAEELHWIKAVGIVDGDGRPADDVAKLKSKGVYATPMISVESVYYHPEVQRRVAARQAIVDGSDPAAKLASAKTAAMAQIPAHADRLARHAAHSTVRETYWRQVPGMTYIEAAVPYAVNVDVAAIVTTEKTRLASAQANGNLEEIIQHYAVRTTPALGRIARCLGFQDTEQYEAAVRKLLIDDPEAVVYVRGLFSDLVGEIG